MSNIEGWIVLGLLTYIGAFLIFKDIGLTPPPATWKLVCYWAYRTMRVLNIIVFWLSAVLAVFVPVLGWLYLGVVIGWLRKMGRRLEENRPLRSAPLPFSGSR